MMRGKKRHISESGLNMVLFEPLSTWIPPSTFPCLSSANIIGLDIESKDPGLTSRGPGFIRGDAAISGVSLSTSDASWYFPMRHLGGGNLDPIHVSRFLRDLLMRKDLTTVGANLQYELEGLSSDGVDIKGKLVDVQIAEALIDEEADEGYSLSALSLKYLGESKDETLLRRAATAYGIDPKKDLWKLHSKFVGPYAEVDAKNPLRIWEKQKLELERQELWKIWQLEQQVLPILWLMRKQGVPVDLERASQLSKDLKKQEDKMRQSLRDELGFHVNEWSSNHMASICTKIGMPIPKTLKGNASFTGEILESSPSPILKTIAKLRALNRLRSTFVDDWIFGNEIKGRIHPQWKQLANDEGGTRTGRLAAANPNPQQVPSRDELASLIRACLDSTKDGADWAKFDYSQQEPRIMVHYASLCNLLGADLVKMAYINNPNMDFYQFLVDASQLTRRDSKDATLGRMYNMGVRKYALKYNKSEQEAQAILDKFDTALPFVKMLGEQCTMNAQRRGFIRTAGGRKRHFDYWEPVDAWKLKEQGTIIKPLRKEQAELAYPGKRLQRAWTHKAMNSLIQGSAADMTKMCMVQNFKQYGAIPYLQVHDETDYPVDSEATAEKYKHVAVTCMPLQVPMKVDMKYGKHWS